MRRRELLVALGSAAIWPHSSLAQQSTAPVIGFLNSASSAGRANFVAAFRRGLRELGFIEGQNVTIEYRWANDQYGRLPELVAELVHRQVNVIAAIGTAAPGRAAKAATSTIPIVFQTGGDPVKEGLVASLNRPGGNITGTHIFQTGIESKRLSLLHEVVPRSAKIAVLCNPNSAASDVQLQDLQIAARSLQRQLHILNAGAERDIEEVLEGAFEQEARGLLITSDVLFNSQHRHIVSLAARHSIPAMYSGRFYVSAGGLMSYGTDIADGYKQTGVYVGRILKGEKPTDMPVLQSSKFEFVLNLATARALGLNIPSGILAIVDEVIE